MRSIEQRLDARARTRAWRGEQCHVVATGHESLAQQIDDRLDPTVTGRRHRNPRRRKHRDPQRLDTDASRGQQPEGRARGAHRELRIGNTLALHLEPVRSVGVTSDRSACGAEPSRYSSAGGSGEENNLTWIDARAMQRGQCSIERGQCSIVDPRAFGLMLRPQRGQFRNDIGARTRGIQLATLQRTSLDDQPTIARVGRVAVIAGLAARSGLDHFDDRARVPRDVGRGDARCSHRLPARRPARRGRFCRHCSPLADSGCRSGQPIWWS